MSDQGRFIPLLLDRIPPLRWLRRLLPSGQSLVILVPYLWLLAFFVVPFVIVAKISVSDQATAMPPYTEIVRSVAGGQLSFAGGKQAPGAAPATETAPADLLRPRAATPATRRRPPSPAARRRMWRAGSISS